MWGVRSPVMGTPKKSRYQMPKARGAFATLYSVLRSTHIKRPTKHNRQERCIDSHYTLFGVHEGNGFHKQQDRHFNEGVFAVS